MENKLKIMVVDDHDFFRQGVVMTLSHIDEFQIVGEACNGEDFLQKVKKLKPDLVLMDIKMPEMDGVEATIKGFSLMPNLKVIAFTMFGDQEYLQAMLDAGAHGFILKNIGRDNLIEAIQKVMSGQQYYSEEMLSYFTEKYLKKDIDDKPKISEKELEVLKYIAEGLNNHEMAKKMQVTIRTISNHRLSLLKKTTSKNTLSLIAYAVKHNLM